MLRNFAVFATLVAGLAVTAGCSAGGNEATVPPAKAEKPSPSSPAATRALRDPASAPSTVVAYWRYVGTGALPALLDVYDPDALAALGIAQFAGALAAQQGSAASLELNVLDFERVANGNLVFAELIPDVGPKFRHSFFLRRQQGSWDIVYDTFSAVALASFVQVREQRRINPSAKTPSPRALQAADEVLALFRRVALAPRKRAPQSAPRGAGPASGESSQP